MKKRNKKKELWRFCKHGDFKEYEGGMWCGKCEHKVLTNLE